jgi:hypothetical protein
MNLPSDTQHISIVGANGSGKTQAAMWHLSQRNFLFMPWVVLDYKGDEMIQSIEGAIPWPVENPAPEHPGIYVVKPHPGQTDLVDALLWSIWQTENIGLYVDEGYMLGTNNHAFRALLTQGRSKHIPMIVLSQRPRRMDTFVFSEAQFFQIFRLQRAQDVKAVEEFIPFDLSARLPEYHSYYYDVKANQISVMQPVPDEDAILDTFYTKLRKLQKVI